MGPSPLGIKSLARIGVGAGAGPSGRLQAAAQAAAPRDPVPADRPQRARRAAAAKPTKYVVVSDDSDDPSDEPSDKDSDFEVISD